MCYRLSDQHPIEGVAVGAGQPPGPFGIRDTNWKFLEPLTRDTARDIGDRLGAR